WEPAAPIDVHAASAEHRGRSCTAVGFMRNSDSAGASAVDDEPVRVIEDIDAVRGHAYGIEDDPGRVIGMPSDSYLPHDVTVPVEPECLIEQRGRSTRGCEIEKDASRVGEALLVERHLGVQLESDPNDVRQDSATNVLESGAVPDWSRRHRLGS